MIPNLGFLPRDTFSAEQAQRLELLETHLVLDSNANSLLTTHWVRALSPAFQLRALPGLPAPQPTCMGLC